MFTRAAILLLIASVLLSPIAASAENLLTNAGFEAFSPDTNLGEGIHHLHDWRYFSRDGAAGQLTAVTPGYEGNIALRLTRTGLGGDSGIDRDFDKIPVFEGRRYRATVWAKTETAGNMLLVLAAHNADGEWLGIEATAAHPVGSAYKQYAVEFVAPTNTAFLNFAIRVTGTGSIIVDDCELIDLSLIPATKPVITYPVGEVVDSFKPTIAFASGPHTAYQAIVSNGGMTVWDSGKVDSTAYTLTCLLNLTPEFSYEVKVRVMNPLGWSDYSDAAQFSTPSAPAIRFTNLFEADVIRGPSFRVRWLAECPDGISSQTIALNDEPPIELTRTRRNQLFSNLSEGLNTITHSATSPNGTTTQSVTFYVRMTPAEAGTIYYYDLSYTSSYSRSILSQARMLYDVHLAVAALQGLVNRNGPRLFVRYWSEDGTWWTRMRESGNWLANKTVVTLPTGIDNLHVLFDTFRDDFEGAVLWDSGVWATSNVATTVAGADDLIPIRYNPAAGSVYDRLVTNGPQIAVVKDLVGKFTGSGLIWETSIPSTGSAKNDAYIWARTKYLETGKSNPSLLNYSLDSFWETSTIAKSPAHGLLARDYVVMNRGFVVDLSPWPDETPVDDPNQTVGLDLNTYRSILSAAAERAPGMIHVIHCVPWPFKYSNWANAGGTRPPVALEWECTGLISQYNAYSDADSYNDIDFPNASIYTQFPLPDRLTQGRRPSHTELRKQGYVDVDNHVSPLNYLNIYMGDYDAASWLALQGTSKWVDGYRGFVPISWPFNPNLVERAAAVLEYYYRTATTMDSFIAGNSGAGYVKPSNLLHRDSGLPSARDLWIEHNLKYFRQASIKISGFLINGNEGALGPDVDEMFEQFSPDGTFSQPGWYVQGDHLSGSMPALLMQTNVSSTVSAAADVIQPRGLQEIVNFLCYRSVLTTPTYVWNLRNTIASRDTSVSWTLVDTHTYAALAKNHLGMVPDNRATYTFDTIPDRMASGEVVEAHVGIRNDGWVTWQAGDVTLRVMWKLDSQVVKFASYALPDDLPSSAGIILDLMLEAPVDPGEYTLEYEMARGGVGFSSLGDYTWVKTVIVDPPIFEGTTADAKTHPDGTLFIASQAVVSVGTDQLEGMFYIQALDRTSGIRVKSSDISVLEGDLVSVRGILATEDTERVLTEAVLLSKQSGAPPVPIGMSGKSLGGGDLNEYTPGIPGAVGLHNTGLLIAAWGLVTHADASGDYLYIDDGSVISDGSGFVGIRVDLGDMAAGNSIDIPSEGEYAVVIGISSRLMVDDVAARKLIPRKQADIISW